MGTHARNVMELPAYRERIDHERQRAYVEQNNWILFPEKYPAPNHARTLGVEALISMEQAPVFNSMNREYWKKYFAQFGGDELREHIHKLGYHPGKNRGSLVGRLCVHYRGVVNA